MTWDKKNNSQFLQSIRKLFLFFLLIDAASLYAQNSKPNIIYILADDLGYGDVSCLNKNSKIKTVNIDRLASQGMRFTDAHSNSAVCTPTRYGVLTGRYAWRTKLQNGVLWSYDTALIDKERMTVPSFLQQQGYNTACIGKWHLGLQWDKDAAGNIDLFKTIKNGPNDLGFGYFYGITASLDIPPYVYIQNNKITATRIDTIEETNGKRFWRKGPIGNDFKHEEVLPALTNKAIEYIQKSSKQNKPFFLYVALPSPHTPILPLKDYLGKSATNAYGDFVLMTDDMVGKIMKTVKEAGIEKNTLIIFTSDNGCSPTADFKELEQTGHNPSYKFRGTKADIFEGGHRVPFIAQWTGKIKPASICDTTISLTDLMATCASIVNKRLPDNAGEDSYDLVPLLLNNKNGDYLRTSTIHHSIQGNFAIREGKWKLVFSAGSGGWSYPTPNQVKELKLPPLQLYNLETDIAETNNVIDEYPDIKERLTIQIEKIINNGRSTFGKNQPNDVPVVLYKY